MSKLETPDWIKEGYDSPAEYAKAKGIKKKSKKKVGAVLGELKVKICPKCKSRDVGVVIGEIGQWECKKCKWQGEDIDEEPVSEEKYFKILEKMEGK